MTIIMLIIYDDARVFLQRARVPSVFQPLPFEYESRVSRCLETQILRSPGIPSPGGCAVVFSFCRILLGVIYRNESVLNH